MIGLSGGARETELTESRVLRIIQLLDRRHPRFPVSRAVAHVARVPRTWGQHTSAREVKQFILLICVDGYHCW
jgi:hypothetical protein